MTRILIAYFLGGLTVLALIALDLGLKKLEAVAVVGAPLCHDGRCP